MESYYLASSLLLLLPADPVALVLGDEVVPVASAAPEDKPLAAALAGREEEALRQVPARAQRGAQAAHVRGAAGGGSAGA